MFLDQDILVHHIVPKIEPFDLVPFGMINKVVHKVVDKYVRGTVIERTNNMLGKFFGENVGEFKRYMNDTGIYMSRGIILQHILGEMWVDYCLNIYFVRPINSEGIEFYSEVTDSEWECIMSGSLQKCNVYHSFKMLLKKWGIRITDFSLRNICIFRKGNKYIQITFIPIGGYTKWLSVLQSRYYVQNNVDVLDIVPSYNGIIHKTAKDSGSIIDPSMGHTLKILKKWGFKMDENLGNARGKFEVTFIDCIRLDKKVYRHRYRYNDDDRLMFANICPSNYTKVVGNIISFEGPYKLRQHMMYRHCSRDVCNNVNNHFHYDVYVAGYGSEYKCIFVIV